jgi:hypothetical protein
MNNFIKAIDFTLPWETGRTKNGQLPQDGGYTNDPDDPGGETKWGISKRAHPNEDIKNLSLDRAFTLYKTDYYDIYKKFKNDPLDLDAVPTDYAVCMFDGGVNCGVNRSYSWHLSAIKEKDPTAKLLSLRLDRYNQLVTNNPALKKYYNGWINRMNDLKKYVVILNAANL